MRKQIVVISNRVNNAVEVQFIKVSTEKPVIKATPGTVLELVHDIRKSGIIFSAGFVKRTNGEYRVINCRTSVKKELKGVGLKFKPIQKHLLSVFDMNLMEYRFINMDSLIWLKYRGQVYIF